MAIRADFASVLQLKLVEAEAVDAKLLAGIKSAIAHLASRTGGHRRGGRKLLEILESCRRQAAEVGEWHVVRLIQDTIDYSEGRILKPVFEENYRLFQDGKRSETNRDFAARSMQSMTRWAAETSAEFLTARPDASVADLVEHFQGLAADAEVLDAPPDRPGRYRILRGRAELVVWLERIMRDRVDVEDAREAARRISLTPEAVAFLADDSEGRILLRAVELQRRAAGLVGLRSVVEDPLASESELQGALTSRHWIFGGRFIGHEPAYRRLVPGNEYDIPLVRGDGTLHVVEIKRSAGLKGPLVKEHRGAWVAAAPVHDAVSQAMDYLMGLDEHRLRIRREIGLETRRANAMVLIGHPLRHPEIPEEAINEALRTLNSHLSRIEVLTYKDLLDSAERSLALPEGDTPAG
ncbi:Shedu anti-phage system protein SduA domain-containing protein [Actinocorallia libanotica]|uniref:Shedu protein SduA C-terminal domain-containing protein n=1 Tax=Actinocorallia libanotica TaxID=46162 RepID=A0ABP4AR55_9ACTN